MPMEKYKPAQIVGVLRQIDLPPIVGPLFMLVHRPLQPGGAERNPAVTARS